MSPVVTITGYPLSGKTSIAIAIRDGLIEWAKNNEDRLNEDFKQNDQMIKIVGEEVWGGNRMEAFKSLNEEKKVRAQVMSAVERYIGKKKIVIVDWANDIKSIRYQLYCQARARNTKHCVIHVERERFEIVSSNDSSKYSNELLTKLINRYEPPYYSNPWDSPLFYASKDKIDINKIAEYLLCDGVKVKSSICNNQLVTSPVSIYIQKAEKIVSETLKLVIKVLEESNAWDEFSLRVPLEIKISDNVSTIKFTKKIPSKTELYRARTKFSSIIKNTKESSEDLVCDSFVQFISSHFS